ncbi:MAG: methylmalonyl Co-A mutase-associated GTPase MeaB [Lysobacterales bacterium]
MIVGNIDTERLKAGDRRSLAKAITLVESRVESHRKQAEDLLNALLPDTGNALRIGISGSPGVGKSTFIEAFGLHLLQAGKSLAVLAVDPSSPIAGGSILGDKTRMTELSRHQGAFIRPSPSAGALGGVAQRTRENLQLCDAAGFDVILVETVGVGQSEFDVAAMVDLFMVLMLPNSGDELQGIKRGILELAQLLVINKADGDQLTLAEQAAARYQSALALLRQMGSWTPRVMTCSAMEATGIDEVWDATQAFFQQSANDGSLAHNRQRQAVLWMERLVGEILQRRLMSRPAAQSLKSALEQQVRAGQITPFSAASQLAADR